MCLNVPSLPRSAVRHVRTEGGGGGRTEGVAGRKKHSQYVVERLDTCSCEDTSVWVGQFAHAVVLNPWGHASAGLAASCDFRQCTEQSRQCCSSSICSLCQHWTAIYAFSPQIVFPPPKLPGVQGDSSWSSACFACLCQYNERVSVSTPASFSL